MPPRSAIDSCFYERASARAAKMTRYAHAKAFIICASMPPLRVAGDALMLARAADRPRIFDYRLLISRRTFEAAERLLR